MELPKNVHSATSNKLIPLILVGFMGIVFILLVNIFRQVTTTQSLISTQTQAVDVIQPKSVNEVGKWCGLPCNYACDPAMGAICGLGLECTQTSSGNRCRNPQSPTRADCGVDGSQECGESCDPMSNKNCRAGLVCLDQPTGGSICLNPNFPDDIECKNTPKQPQPTRACEPSCINGMQCYDGWCR